MKHACMLKALLVAVALGLGCPAAAEDGLTAAFAGEIKILTINAWSGLTYEGALNVGRYPDDPEMRYSLLVKGIRSLAPDIVALQEANPLPAYAERLAADLGYRAIYGVALCGIRVGPLGIPANLRHGSVILVKKPWAVEYVDTVNLEGRGIATNTICIQTAENTKALLGRAVVDGKTLYVYAVHFHSGPFRGPAMNKLLELLTSVLPPEYVAEGEAEVEKDIVRRGREVAGLMDFIGKTLPEGIPAVVLGDFNAPPESGELEPMIKGGWVDTFRRANPDEPGVTWDPGSNPNFRQQELGPDADAYEMLKTYHERFPARIDLILTSGAIPPEDIIDSRVVLMPEGGVSPSDHYGVLTTIRW